MLKPIIESSFWGLPVYNLMGSVGFVFAVLVLINNEKKEKHSTDDEAKALLAFLLASLGALLSANIANWFLFPELLIHPPMYRFYNGGLSFYYGMIGFFLISTLLLKIQNSDVRYWIGTIVPSLLIFHAFGRIGCSLIGCCYGREIKPIRFGSISLVFFPARELEAFALFILFFVFQFKIKKQRLFWYLLLYSIVRFVLEFGRGDNRGFLLVSALSPAQVTSVLIWIILLGYIIGKSYRHE